MAEKVKIVFVGTGAMGQCAHLKNYVLIPDCEVVAICEKKKILASKVASKYGIEKVYHDFSEMLEREKFDAIVSSQPFTRHLVMLRELLKAKKPVFIEKPLAGSVEAGEKIIEEIKKAGTWVMVGYHKRNDLSVIYAKEKIERFKQTGELGKMTYIRITMPPGDWVAGGFRDLIKTEETLSLDFDPVPENMDKDTFNLYLEFVNYYIHQVNLIRYLFGEFYSVKYADRTGVLMAVESISGIPGIIEMAPYKTSLDWQEKALVCFEKGFIEISLPAPLVCSRAGRVKIYKDNAIPETMIPALFPISAMYQQAMNFVLSVKGEAKPACLAEEALEDLRIARDYIKMLCMEKRSQV
ncbi:MAG TPA: Gfo/Idh/MocA family oxidoreductase [bacterium]|nr:Gfo/Idh/MocA family oxidoreductase [bacterium]HOL34925.1 Gfo/Idh/MocA family oxidoreductase [bacterium]HPP08305.1 Gfo/Idh/MocA family oxidoreductase [bacterium]